MPLTAPGRLQFRPRLWPTLALFAGLALFGSLGLWQQGKADRQAVATARHEQRSSRVPIPIGAELVDPDQAQDLRFTVKGRYEPERQFFVDNRQENGVPGVHVITPLRIGQSETRILVNRGWIGWGQGRQHLPQVAVPEGEVEISGIAIVPSTKKFFLMPENTGESTQLRMRVDIAKFAGLSPHPLQPIVLLQDAGNAGEGLVRNWLPPENRSDMHRSYALQWLGMAFALLVFYAFSTVQRTR